MNTTTKASECPVCGSVCYGSDNVFPCVEATCRARFVRHADGAKVLVEFQGRSTFPKGAKVVYLPEAR